jgi:tetratricopeptide (TPR) repeat protein
MSNKKIIILVSFLLLNLIIGELLIKTNVFSSNNETDVNNDKRVADPLFILYETYLEEVEKKGKADKRKADIEWVDRFCVAVNNSPESTGRLILLYKALGISNSNNNFEKSKSIAELIMKLEPNETQKILMIGELVEISRLQCLIEKNNKNIAKSKVFAEESINHFLKYKKSIESISKSNEGILKEKYLIYASMAGKLARDELGDFKTAIQFYDTALEMIKNEPQLPEGKFSVGLGYDKAHFLFNKAEALLELESYLEAEQVMDQFGKEIVAGASGLPPSVYALEFVLKARTLKNKDLTEYLERWIKSQKRDPKTFACILYVARQKLGSGKITLAKNYYEDVLQNYWDDVIKKSVDELIQQDGGYISQTLGDLSDIYRQEGNFDKLEKCQAELKKLLPKYDETKKRVSLISPEVKQLEPIKPRSRIVIIGGVIIINIAAIIVLIIIIRRKRKNKR